MEGNYKKWLNRINAKQDVLTEDNVGQFMDSELATKSTPTSGDTVLGRDSVTGKAVEIPTSSLGGNGNVDISNLVPYDNANKDVNIGAFYFESSAGFRTPNGTATQALRADGNVFDLNTKADLVGGKVPQSQLPSSNKTTFTYDILVSNWTLVSGKYEAVISNAGILSNSFVDVIPSNDNVDIVRNAQIYPSVLISEGSVKVYSKFLPSDTITVTVNIN